MIRQINWKQNKLKREICVVSKVTQDKWHMSLLTLSDRLCTSAARLLLEPATPRPEPPFLTPTDSSSTSFKVKCFLGLERGNIK
jgi:hypothetical protein